MQRVLREESLEKSREAVRQIKERAKIKKEQLEDLTQKDVTEGTDRHRFWFIDIE